MPVYPMDQYLADFDGSEERILRACFTGRGRFCKDNGNMRLRSSKPFNRPETIEQGCANYAWRMLCFDLVGHGKHVCMPVCADFDLEDQINDSDGGRIRYRKPGYEEQRGRVRNMRDAMDDLTKRFETNIPIEQQAGVVRWGHALGMLS